MSVAISRVLIHREYSRLHQGWIKARSLRSLTLSLSLSFWKMSKLSYEFSLNLSRAWHSPRRSANFRRMALLWGSATLHCPSRSISSILPTFSSSRLFSLLMLEMLEELEKSSLSRKLSKETLRPGTGVSALKLRLLFLRRAKKVPNELS